MSDEEEKELGLDKINITQDVKVLQQILNKVLKTDNKNGGVTLNVVTVGQIVHNPTNNKKEKFSLTKEELTEAEKLIISLLDLIPETPEGRLKTLNRLVIGTCLSVFDNDAAAAEYLGISRRMMSYNKNKRFNTNKDET